MVRFHKLFVWISVLMVFLDQLLKWLFLHVGIGGDFGFLRFHLVKNTGAGFGILQGHTGWLALISFLVAVVLLWSYKEIPQEKLVQIWYALFFGGVVGNLIDRTFLGFVVDFIDFGWWPAFNIADMGIVVGAIGLVVYFWKK